LLVLFNFPGNEVTVATWSRYYKLHYTWRNITPIVDGSWQNICTFWPNYIKSTCCVVQLCVEQWCIWFSFLL